MNHAKALQVLSTILDYYCDTPAMDDQEWKKDVLAMEEYFKTQVAARELVLSNVGTEIYHLNYPGPHFIRIVEQIQPYLGLHTFRLQHRHFDNWSDQGEIKFFINNDETQN